MTITEHHLTSAYHTEKFMEKQTLATQDQVMHPKYNRKQLNQPDDRCKVHMETIQHTIEKQSSSATTLYMLQR